jgi:hypothetical protein
LWTSLEIIASRVESETIKTPSRRGKVSAHCHDLVDSLISDNCEEVSLSGNHQCCVLMKNNIQALEKEIKSLTEIINILSEQLKYDIPEEVRKADCTYADKLKSKNTISCHCDLLNHSF